MKSWDMLFNVSGHYTGPEVEELMNYPAAIAACSEKLILSEMNEKDLMKISELSKRSGIPISTIRYYILEGLLPTAIKTGKTRAYYSGLHLKALNLIRHKQVDEKKPLNVIREEIEKEVSFPGSPVKQSDLSSDKWDAILSFSTALFLTKGYIETNTSDIAHHVKISKETVYKHFRNKEEILMACADRVFHDLYNHIWDEIKEEKDAALRLIKRGKVFFSLYPKWISMMNLVRSLSVGDNPSFRAKFHHFIQQMVNPTIREIEVLKQEGRIRKDIDSELAGYILTGMTEHSAWLIQQEHYSEVMIMESLTSILYEGVIVSPS
jgi:AcrR family transcriptional regulator